jgi:hypothetical protein
MSADSRRHAQQVTTMVTGSAVLRVAWWRSPLLTVDLGDDYGRRYWLPIIGPTCYLLAQQLGDTLTRTSESAHPVTVPARRLAEALGIGGSLGPHAALVRSVARLALFDLAIADDGVLALSSGWPLLSHRQHRRLPAWLAEQHTRDLAQVIDTRRSA